MAAVAWPKGSVKDVAESIGIGNLSDDVATALAADVEYRLREVVEESLKFMRHGKRTRLKVDDVDYALKVRNIEPLWGFASPHAPIAFRKTTSTSGNLYFVDDEEVDLARLSNADLPPIPREISYTAHWLAVEGVQPAIPQNPSPAEVRAAAATSRPSGRTSAIGPDGTEVRPLVVHALSKELQLYFDRLTSAAVDADETMRTAALESFRGDTGLQGLVAYLVQWIAERVANSLTSSLPVLDQCLDILEAMLQNSSLFVEPYLHQILPAVLSILLSASLGPTTPAGASANPYSQDHTSTREHAASFLSFLLARYSKAYAALKPRVLQTVLRGLFSSASAADGRASGTLVGALLGLRALGKDVVRKVLGSQSPNLQKIGEALQREGMTNLDRTACENTVLDALRDSYHERATASDTFDYAALGQLAGPYFAPLINSRCPASVAAGVLADPAAAGEIGPSADSAPDFHLRHGVNGERPPSRNGASSDAPDAEGSGEDDDDVDMEAVQA